MHVPICVFMYLFRERGEELRKLAEVEIIQTVNVFFFFFFLTIFLL